MFIVLGIARHPMCVSICCSVCVISLTVNAYDGNNVVYSLNLGICTSSIFAESSKQVNMIKCSCFSDMSDDCCVDR